MQRDQTLISVTNILTTGDIASVSSYIAGEFSLATTVNALKNKALPTLANGMLRYNGSAWVFDNTAYLAISAVNNGGPTETLISRIRSDSTQLATLSWDGFNMVFNRSPLISTLTGGSNGMVGVNSSGALFRATAGADYLSSTVGNAVSATKLLNARTIGLSGGVTGTATSFDGTANITIPVTTVAPSFIGTGYTQNRFYIDTHPEGGGVIIPFINNDIAHLIARGGTMTSYKTSDTTFTAQTLTNIGSVAIDTTAPFDGSPSYAYVPTLAVTDKLIIDITCPSVYSYGTTVYIDFGNSGWSAKDVSFYAYNSNVNNSETLYKAFGGAVTNNQQGRYFVVSSYSYVNTSSGTSQGFNKLRIVLTNFQGTSPRIAAIGVVNFDSRGLIVPFMSRAGGALYGSITPQTTNTLNLGSASNLFANVYTTSAKIGTINGMLKGVSGVVTLAVAGTDYVVPSALSSYLPLAGGTLNTGSQILTNKDITPSASTNTNYSQTPLVAQRATNTGTTTVAGVGFHNLGVNAAALYYDAALSIFKYNRHTGDIVTIWDSSNFTPGAYLPLAGGTMTGRILSTVSGFNSYDSAIVLNSADPSIFFSSTSAGTNNKKWRIRCTSGVWRIDSYDDAESNAESPFEIQRTSGSSVINNMYLRSAAITLSGTTTISTLAGTGTRLTTVSSTGVLGATSFIDDGPWLPVSGGVVTGSTTFSAGLTTSSLYASGTTILAGGLTGVTDGSSAASGKVGEILSASASGAVFSGTTAGVSLVSLSLPAGAWLVWGCAHISNGQSPLSLRVFLSYSSTGTTYIDSNTSFSLGIPVASSGITCHNAPTPINRSSTATVYLIGSEITTGTAATNNGASIFAQRIR